MSFLWQGIDWARMFVPKTPLLEIFLRGTLIYVGVFVLLRVILKRQIGSMTLPDLLILVMIADAAQNGMADDYTSITEGLLLISTLVFWNLALDWLGYHFRFFERFLHPPPLPLIENGRVNRANLRRELVTREELLSQLREQGIEDVRAVKRACIEANGEISVIPKTEKPSGGGAREHPAKR